LDIHILRNAEILNGLSCMLMLRIEALADQLGYPQTSADEIEERFLALIQQLVEFN